MREGYRGNSISRPSPTKRGSKEQRPRGPLFLRGVKEGVKRLSQNNKRMTRDSKKKVSPKHNGHHRQGKPENHGLHAHWTQWGKKKKGKPVMNHRGIEVHRGLITNNPSFAGGTDGSDILMEGRKIAEYLCRIVCGRKCKAEKLQQLNAGGR